MKYFLYLLFLIQFQNCKSDTVSTSAISSNKEIKVEDTIQDNYLINSIDKIAIRKKIEDKNKIIQLKTILENALGREVVRPYMWDLSGGEIVGQGDHYLLPKTASALFGIINDVNEKGWGIHLGDMSSKNGSDPWEPGSFHHAGHGHIGTRKGLDCDFRYLNTLGKSYQGLNTSSVFDGEKNKTVFTFAYKYGFRKNFCANPVTVLGSTVSGVIHQRDHDDHGHIGLTDLDLEEVSSINVTKI